MKAIIFTLIAKLCKCMRENFYDNMNIKGEQVYFNNDDTI